MKYSVRGLSAEEARAEVVDLWRRLDVPDPLRRYDWAYAADARCFLLDATDGGNTSVVGMVGVDPREIVVDGVPRSAALLMGFQVEKAHRTFFPALTLQRHVMSWTRERFDLVYGFPNESAQPIMKKLGFRVLTTLRRHALSLRHTRFVAELVDLPVVTRALAAPLDAYRLLVQPALWQPAPLGRALAHFDAVDARFDRLSTSFADLTHGARHARLLRRRFLERPDEHTRVHALYERRAGELAAWVVTHVRDEVAYVRDLHGRDVPSMTTALRLVAAQHRAAGCSSMSFLCAAPPELSSALAALGFRVRPETRVMIGLPGERLRDNAAAQNALERWYATEADEDQ